MPDGHMAGIKSDVKTNQHGVQVPCSFQDANFKNNYMPALPKMSAPPSARSRVRVSGFEALFLHRLVKEKKKKKYTPGKCFP